MCVYNLLNGKFSLGPLGSHLVSLHPRMLRMKTNNIPDTFRGYLEVSKLI